MEAIRNVEDLPALLSPADVQKLFCVSRPVCYQLFETAGFPSFRIGRKRYVRKELLIRWMDANALQPGKESASNA